MSLFQKSVEQKYLWQLDSRLINAKYSEFRAYFGNPAIQENIRSSKEEQFQEGFLSELFVKILGYTLNPNPNFKPSRDFPAAAVRLAQAIPPFGRPPLGDCAKRFEVNN